MYKPKPTMNAAMPSEGMPLKVLVLNASLRHRPEISNTEEVAEQVLAEMRTHTPIESEIVRLADCTIPVGLLHRESDDDEWPAIVAKLKAADVVIFDKVAGVVITGSEDGAQQVLGSIMEVLTFMNFTLPPECCADWVGEVGKPVAEERATRRMNAATQHMAKNMARNLVYYGQLLKMHPLVPEMPVPVS